jgi:peptidoglycan hydrolase-like protein with peptidoglycan-binding domain
VVAPFQTIYWTDWFDPRVADIQRRLAQLNYLTPNTNNEYVDSARTLSQMQWRPRPDNVGYYQNTTDAAVRAFEFDYIQHDQGTPPNQGCDTATYQALVDATS